MRSPNFSAKDIKYEHKLDRTYFRQEVVELSKSLLGKVMVRKTEQGLIKAVIVETEAYKAPLDKGCHAYNSIFCITKTKKLRKRSTSGWTAATSTSTRSTCPPTSAST